MNQEYKLEIQALQKIKKSESELPKTENMVTVLSLLNESEKFLAKQSSSVAIQYQDEVFFVRPHVLIPADATVMRDRTGQMLRMPAVGSG